MKPADFIKLIEQVGWVFVRQNGGSHKIFKHPDKPNNLSVPFHKGKDINAKLLRRLLKDAGLR
jgi:predicted RNA binding protein YcfA (HicA-like mRNA interferase family)